ncbi:hypothetical protein Y032_1006g3374 [Ancylostoma ceylanicum]|uniref:Endonuclease/exonuclease/phosphatase domain-containing protein n=1 Tax=Ancylostoma ceylanicum TaxID=53326 RepID=A0A016W9H5_9BILA|nr:hypothetical protein Y032_1006g3374 [Ancylostoma ceylanicum]
MADKDGEEPDKFHSDLGDLVHSQKSTYIVVMGDFNARIGLRTVGELFVGPNSAQQRNEAGERFTNFCKTSPWEQPVCEESSEEVDACNISIEDDQLYLLPEFRFSRAPCVFRNSMGNFPKFRVSEGKILI